MLFPLAGMDHDATLQSVWPLLYLEERYGGDLSAYFPVFLIPPGEAEKACAQVTPSASKGPDYGVLGFCSELSACRETLGKAFNRFLPEEFNTSSENRWEEKRTFFHTLHLLQPHTIRWL